MFLMNYFILLATFALITKIVSFPISIKTISEEAYYFNTVMQLINPNYPLKNEVKKNAFKWHLSTPRTRRNYVFGHFLRGDSCIH